MIFTKIYPSEHLRRIIRYFWSIELNCANGSAEFSERILPDASSEMVFHLGDKISRISTDNETRREPNSFFAGPNTRCYHISARGFITMIGAKFYPHTASCLFRENARQFHDTVVDLTAICGDSISRLHERIAEATSLQDRISTIESFLRANFANKSSVQFEYLDYAVHRIFSSRGQVTLARMAKDLGITPRYLERLFRERVGIPAKRFAQITQLQSSVLLMKADKNRSLTDVSHASGYYDQSHFNRAIKRFTGLKPSELKREEMLTQQPFLDAAVD